MWSDSGGPPDLESKTTRVRSSKASTSSLFGRRRVDGRLHLRDPVHGEAALLRMLAQQLFAGRDVDAVNLVGRHEAFHPLDRRPKFVEHAAGSLRDAAQLFRC